MPHQTLEPHPNFLDRRQFPVQRLFPLLFPLHEVLLGSFSDISNRLNNKRGHLHSIPSHHSSATFQHRDCLRGKSNVFCNPSGEPVRSLRTPRQGWAKSRDHKPREAPDRQAKGKKTRLTNPMRSRPILAPFRRQDTVIPAQNWGASPAASQQPAAVSSSGRQPQLGKFRGSGSHHVRLKKQRILQLCHPRALLGTQTCIAGTAIARTRTEPTKTHP